MQAQHLIAMLRRLDWKQFARGVLLGGLAGICCEFLNLDVLLLSFNHIVPVMAIVGGLMGLTRLRCVLLPINAVLFAAIVLISYSPLAAHLPRGLDGHDPLQAADAVVVLQAAYINDQTISSSGEDRILKGLEVLHGGYAMRLIVTRSMGPAAQWISLIRSQLQALGINADIIEAGDVKNTHDESIVVANICRQHGWKRIILVTHAWHMQRAAALFARQGLEVVRCPADESEYDSLSVTGPGDKLAVFRCWLHERVGLWVYEWRGWI